VLLIQFMPAQKGRGPTPKRPKTEARRADDRGPQGPVGRGIIGETAASPLAISYSLGSAISSALGSGAEPRQPKCFPAPKATVNCRKKCHHIWSSSLLGTIYCYSSVPLALSYGRDNRQIISTCDDSANTYVSHSTVPHLHRN